MPYARKHREFAPPVIDSGGPTTVLVVDDSRAQRRILTVYLARWGYRILEAGSGEEALEICASDSVDMVVSDWMMPGMNGLDFCKEFRKMQRDHYGYFILLTSRSEKAAVARGLDIGADDFLTKPVASDELLARIRAGERILRMERELTEKNRLVSSTLAEISTLYDALDRDLAEARKLQQSLVRERFRDFGGAQVSLMLRPSGHVGGDLVGFFAVDSDNIAIFSIDVSGHGVASALLTARLAAYLSGGSRDHNLALGRHGDGAFFVLPPSDVARRMNRLMLEEMETEHYFTMLFAHINIAQGRIAMVQCGHPHPAVQRADGTVEFHGTGGLPVGLFAEASWRDHEMQLCPGDRLLFYSDGITECTNESGAVLGESGLATLLKRSHALRGPNLLEAMIWDLANFGGAHDFGDDISAIMLEIPP